MPVPSVSYLLSNPPMQNRDQLYIDGRWTAAGGGKTLAVVSPSTEETIARVPEGTPQDVDAAVAAARAAFGGGSARGGGHGPVAGEAPARPPKVDLVSFAGSGRGGKRVAELGAQTVKRVTLELGGKSASIILDAADLAPAVKGTVNACLLNS